MTQPLETLTAALLDAAKRAGADAADAIAVEGTSLSIGVREGKLEQAERSEGTEIGLRVMLGQRQACVSASDTRTETMAEMAARAVAMAKEAPEDSSILQASAAQMGTPIDVAALELEDTGVEPTPAALQEAAQQAEAAAMAVQGVSQVQSADTGFGRQRLHLATSNGFAGGYGRTSHWTSCTAITGEGTSMERDYNSESRVFASEMPDAAGIGKIAGERTVAMAGACKPPTGSYPVLFDERISSSLIAHLLAAINGNAIVRGASWLRDAMGEQVLPKGLSLIEDPHRPRIPSSRPFDGEGLATAQRAFVEDGVLQSWVLDLSTAQKLELESTANASRGTSSPPSPSAGGITLTPGDKTRDDLISDMGTGLLVTSMIGSTINPNTGDYSRGASGFWVKNGQISHPVNECTIAGNLRDMLMRIIPANDARAHLTRRVPSLLIEGLTLAGE